MIELKSVSYRSASLEAINLSFRLNAGETAVILGPDKPANSSFLKVCMGAHAISAGEVLFDGENLERLRDSSDSDLWRKICFIAREPALLDNLTVTQNTGLPLSYHLGWSEERIFEKAGPVLKEFGLWHVARDFPSQIGKDDAKMTQLARAAVLDPKVLLFDEPAAGGLNPEIFLRILGAFKYFQARGTSVLFATASPSLAAAMKIPCYLFVEGRMAEITEARESPFPEIREYVSRVRRQAKQQSTAASTFFKRISAV